MDFSYLLNKSIKNEQKLLAYGFIKNSDFFNIRKKVNDSFYAIINLNDKNVTAEVFDCETDEKYALLNVKNAGGTFVGELRQKVTLLVENIIENCFETTDLKIMLEEWILKELKVSPEFPWKDTPEFAVYRTSKNKWFALLMDVKFKSLGVESDEKVWCVNLKYDSQKIPELIDNHSIFPAYHMNKKHWITVLLSAVTDFEKLKSLVLRSKELTE